MKKSLKSLFAALSLAGGLMTAGSVLAQINVEPSPNGEVNIVVDFAVKPDKQAEFERVFHRSVTCARLESGNITFNVHRVIDQPLHYVLYEQWRSPDALNSPFERPYTKALFAMFDRDLQTPVNQGLRFIADMQPAPRPAPSSVDPTSKLECR